MNEVEFYNDVLAIIDSYVEKIGSDHRGIYEDQNCLVTDEVVALVKNHVALDLHDVSSCDISIHNAAIKFSGKCGKCGSEQEITEL